MSNIIASLDVVLFAEDPGAANFIAPLPAALGQRGLRAHMVASDTGAVQMRRLGAVFEMLDSATPAEALLAALHPRLVVAGSSERPDPFGLRLIAAARRAGIATVGAVDGPANAEHRFGGVHTAGAAGTPDWVLVPDAATRNAFLRAGYPEARVAAVGHPHFDAVRATGARLELRGRAAVRAALFPDIVPERRLLVFATEVSTGLDPSAFRRRPDYTLSGRGQANGRTEIVLEEVLEGLRHMAPRPALVLRAHPKNRRREFAAYANEVDAMSERGSAIEVVYAADGVVGMSSILLMEAAILGRPTLSVLPRACERDWLASIGLGLTSVVHRREELVPALKALLDAEGPAASKIARLIPRHAGERAAAAICAVMNATTRDGRADSGGWG